jgi:xanthine/CO dehydrogenase XdhC/CoxF family maturation factor
MLRSEIHGMIDLAERLLAAGEVGVVATLFSARGSTYRPLGSMMVAGPGSMSAGGVSGGCLEEYIARHGRLLAMESRGCMLSFDTDPDAADADKPTLGCGGAIEVLVERLTVEHVNFLHDLAAAHERDVQSAACCEVIVAEDGAIQVARSAFLASPDICGTISHVGSTSSPRPPRTRLTLFQNAAGRDVRTLIHHVEPMTRLVIFGAGDDVKPLCAIAQSLGWHVTVVDRRARRASPQRFPKIDQLIATQWDQAINNITFTSRTAVLLMTHSLTDDIEILPLLLEIPMAYFGALGPAHRRQWVIDGALTTASLPEDFLERFKGPIGLNLGERSPAGIALAISAEIAAALNGRNARALSQLYGANPLPSPSLRHG